VTIFGGIPSTFIGGYLGDKYEPVFPKAKGYISGFGALSSCIFIIMTYFVQVNFWLSISMLYFAYLTAECWLGISYSMIN